MNVATALKFASLFALLAIGIQGAAFARETVTITNSTINGNQVANGSAASGKRQHKPFVITKELDNAAPAAAPGRDIASRQPDPQPIGLLLPAV